MKISKRFIIINIISSVTIIFIVFFIFISIDFFYQKKNVLNQLKNINKTISNSVSILLSITVEDHLKMISQKNNLAINEIIKQLNIGMIDKNYAKNKIKNLLKSEKIGKTGYVFIWNIKDAPEKIILDLHPEIEGENVANIDFVQTGYKKKNGYIEYIWQNPSDPVPRYKSMYLNYLPELDWIICYSSYRDEFYYLFDIERLKKII
ncbi:MAG: Cache 3/Cache 2 fusion domain-containing protein, partial [Exilispira sp.]